MTLSAPSLSGQDKSSDTVCSKLEWSREEQCHCLFQARVVKRSAVTLSAPSLSSQEKSSDTVCSKFE